MLGEVTDLVVEDESDERGDLKGDLKGLDTALVFFVALPGVREEEDASALRRVNCFGLGVTTEPAVSVGKDLTDVGPSTSSSLIAVRA
jgi:hypothetical protein